MTMGTIRTDAVQDHAPSLLPSGSQWKLVWNDEFDATALDTSKWGFRRYFWGKRSPTFTDEGVELDGNGSMRIQLIRKGDDFYSAHLQTGSVSFDPPKDSEGFWPLGKRMEPKFMHKFGYYEIRCRLPRNPGWHAAFWLQAPGIGTHPDARYCGVETDIMENYSQHTEGVLLCGNGYGGYGKDCVWIGHKRFPYVETADGWHSYGVDWNPEGYIFYADGEEVTRQMKPECPVSEVEQFLLVSTECHGYHREFGGEAGLAGDANVWHGKPVPELFDAVLPDCFEVDFVRVFDRV